MEKDKGILAMGERIKKVFSNRIFISVLGGIIAYFIVGIINSFAEKINIWDSLLNLPMKIYHIKIPDYIMLIFVLIIVIWLILIFKYLKGPSLKQWKRYGWERLIGLEVKLEELKEKQKEKEEQLINIHIQMRKIEEKILDMEKIFS